MKYIDEFRKRDEAQGLITKIREISRKDVSIMEICGTHTHSISKYGIRDALPKNIKLISGPGCPVCVTSAADVNRVIEFSRSRKDAIIATFGDMMKVPGSASSLQEEKARGSDIRVVYSPLGAIDIARSNREREVVLFAVGFETTVPTVAATILAAKEEGIKNLSVLSLHKLTPPAMKALMDSGEIEIDGFICPGHVTAIIGASSYGFLASEYGSPCVVAGFEPIDALMGIYMLVRQLEEGRQAIEIEYDRVVTWDGNKKAQEIMDSVFEPGDSLWRGIGNIPGSGLRIKDGFSEFDAERKFSIPRGKDEEPKGCMCGSVLKGLMTPDKCPLFARACTPEFPIGPCMVSSEGTCAAFFKYRKVA
ncbi:MAG TPA: hydrogenase formation protein HypD [Deltaproteobacteria bacterium]|nr:MAG: hydrogenase formation protein HypD [Deltaproteobacteria bacterium GWA2_55_82]OIJ74605.1 MAG: hydrogenase formation protein HypD [Deltaproteobacteria bacterium GWC2_55_46]HBG46452.1 hydrogenase formation protein HypD [Deltaproteobacteria bacterium]HCY10664.1 hydrogenase formation protein HypD [Deltaproteobacteria bacterium]